MEKYYDLIVSLIKANRKYPGCEAILEDIVADVYSHAEVVLENVTNESVVTSYLNKLVTTSMITVPRRLGIRTSGLRSITKEAPEQIEQTPAETPEQKHLDTETVGNEADDYELQEVEIQDSVSLGEESEVAEELLLEDEVSEEESLDEVNPESDSAEVEDSIETENADVESLDEVAPPDEAEALSEGIEEVVPEVDKNLVDRMINGISYEESDLDLNLDLDSDTEETEQVLQEDTVDSLEELPMDDTAEDALPEELSAAETEDASDGLLEELPADELLGNDISSLEDVELPESEGVEDTLLDAEDVPSDEEPHVYKCFEFSPKKNDIDYSEWVEKIHNIKTMREDINIMEIMKLKYQDKMSIDDIASKLDLAEEDILDALKEVMYLVKE